MGEDEEQFDMPGIRHRYPGKHLALTMGENVGLVDHLVGIGSPFADRYLDIIRELEDLEAMRSDTWRDQDEIGQKEQALLANLERVNMSIECDAGLVLPA